MTKRGNDNGNTNAKSNLTVEQVNSHGRTYTVSFTPRPQPFEINNNSINNSDNNVEIEMASDITP